MRRFLARALSKAGHRVTAVGDGLEAADRLVERAFDLLLTDVVMPGMTGRDLAARRRLHTGADERQFWKLFHTYS
jgi:two-component system cell cycle response regulator CpdR